MKESSVSEGCYFSLDYDVGNYYKLKKQGSKKIYSLHLFYGRPIHSAIKK